MPENWNHYIGIDFDRIDEAIDRIAAEPELLKEISMAGRAWVLEHYSPVPTALRFLETVGYPFPHDLLQQLDATSSIPFSYANSNDGRS